MMTPQADLSSLDPDPLVQFQRWFKEASETVQPHPEAMSLATVSSDGSVSNRIVLLKGCDPRGFVFFTNYESRKSVELGKNNAAAATFYWPFIDRQVRIEGSVTRTSREESEAYFATRPRGSQLGAWASPQSREIQSRTELEDNLAELEQRFAEQLIPCPPNWGGFVIEPVTIEFWQNRENRLHDRFLYTRERDGWKRSILAP
jgi:pyridoxamine 5'-phosphate oxidase